MLDSMRRHASGWLAKALLALLVASFVLWGGIGQVIQGFSSTEVATVGGKKLDASLFIQQYERTKQAYQRATGRQLTDQTAQMLGIPSQIMRQLIVDEVLNNRAGALRLGVSDAELVRQIQADPTFSDGRGGFNRQAFTAQLREFGWSEDQFIVNRREAVKRELLVESLLGGIGAPKTYLEIAHRFDAEERVVDYVVATATPPAAPAEAELKSFYETRKAAFKAPEYRKVTLMTATVEGLAGSEEIAEDELKRAYDNQSSRYDVAEQRHVQRLNFPDKAAAEAALARLKAGTSLEDIVAELKLAKEDYDLGRVQRAAIRDTVVADAVFALAPGTLSAVINGKFGYAIARVLEVVPASRTPFEAVKADIARSIALDRARERIGHLRNEVEDARAAGGALADVATRLKLPRSTIEAIDAQGLGPDGKPVAGLPEATEFLKLVFETDVHNETDPLAIGTRGFTWFEVEAITPSRERALDEIRDRVLAQYMTEATAKATAGMAAAALERLGKGEELAAVAADLKLEVKTADKLTRAAKLADFGPGALGAIFDVPEGKAGRGLLADGTAFVFVVREASAPVFFAEAAEIAEKRKALDEGYENAMLDQYLVKAQTLIGASVNQTTLARILGGERNP